MAASVASLGIDRLTREERLALVQEIWDSIVAEPAPPALSDSQRDELARRVADDDAAPDDVVPRDQVKAEALARLT